MNNPLLSLMACAILAILTIHLIYMKSFLTSELRSIAATVLFLSLSLSPAFALADKPLDVFQAHPPIHVKGAGHGQSPAASTPTGLTPDQVKAAYNLQSTTGGAGATIAIIDAYSNPNIANDLATFSTAFNLPKCALNTCLTIHQMGPKLRADTGWGLEEELDVQWTHAIAPNAHIMLVEAKSASGNDLLAAVDWARNNGATAVSMSWGGSEFSGESSYDSHFTGPAFFASAGDSGAGVEWPAVSSNVIGVGGTTLNLSGSTFVSETAWSGSGGGLSKYEQAPSFQSNVPQANGFRAVPDVSYLADPQTGVSVYDSYGYQGVKGWFTVGGTSAGAPQWAAISTLGSVSASSLYQDAASANSASFLRDITQGSNGSCGFFCNAANGYDYVTGLGSPVAFNF